MTRPWRRITLHLSQIGLTLGLTFTKGPFPLQRSSFGCLLVAVDDPTSCEVVRRELHHHAVLGEDPDVVLAHLAADVGENLVPVAQLDAEHGIRQGLHDGALDLDHAFFLRHVLHNLLFGRPLVRGPVVYRVLHRRRTDPSPGRTGNLLPRRRAWETVDLAMSPREPQNPGAAPVLERAVW